MNKWIVLVLLATMMVLASINSQAKPTVPATADQTTCSMTSKGLMETWKPYASLPADQFKQKTGYDKSAYLAAIGDAKALWSHLQAVQPKVSAEQYQTMLVSALNSAILWRHRNIVRTLVDRGAPVDGTAEARVHPLFLAVSCRDHKTVQFLADHGADLYVKTKNHKDALWEATELKDKVAVNILLDAGFDPCVDHAIKNGRGEVARSALHNPTQ